MKKPLLFLLALAMAAPAFAQNISGVVTNKTTGKPAAGDTVTLIKLGNGMQEADHTTSDANGKFSLPATDTGMHLVRVTHDNVPYFQTVPPGTTAADVTVYDAAEKVEGVTAEADVKRIQATDNQLEVTEAFFVKNSSSPPRTQFGPRAFEFYLPAEAEVTSGAALAPGGMMPVQALPMKLDDAGHYAFIFRIIPGETRLQVAYRVPYSGKFAFHPRLTLPTENVAIMLPKTMVFFPEKSAAFQPVNDDTNAQVYLLKNATTDTALGFGVSGSGQMPNEDSAQAPAAAEQANAPPANRPGGGLGNPIDTPDPLHKYRWWVLGAIIFLFLIGIAFAMRKPQAARPQDAALTPVVVAGASTTGPAASPVAQAADAQLDNLMSVLKEEMFVLETEHLQGRIEDDYYATVKAGLEIVLRYALKRNKKI